MPTCPKCGKEVYPDAIRCYYCGQTLPHSTHKEFRRNDAIIALIVIVILSVTVYYAGTAFLKQTNSAFQGPQVGSMSFQTCQIVQSNPDYVIVTLVNNGTKDLTITMAYIDGVQAGISGSLSSHPGQIMTFTVTASSGQNIADKASHILKIVAADGTLVSSPITYS